MLDEKKSKKHTSKLLSLLLKLTTPECIQLLKNINHDQMNPMVIAVFHSHDSPSGFYDPIKILPEKSRNKILLQEKSHKEGLLKLLLKYYKHHPEAVYYF